MCVVGLFMIASCITSISNARDHRIRCLRGLHLARAVSGWTLSASELHPPSYRLAESVQFCRFCSLDRVKSLKAQTWHVMMKTTLFKTYGDKNQLQRSRMESDVTKLSAWATRVRSLLVLYACMRRRVPTACSELATEENWNWNFLVATLM